MRGQRSLRMKKQAAGGVVKATTEVCPTEEKSNVCGNIQSITCADVFNVLCKGSQCIVELCPAWPKWSRDLPPSTQGTHPPPLSAWPLGIQSACSSKEGWIWTVYGYSRAAQSGICDCRTVYVHIVLYFSSRNTAFWNIPQMIYLRSTDRFFFCRFD